MANFNLLTPIESVLRIVLDISSNKIDQFIDLDTAYSNAVFAAKDGSLVTMIKLDGSLVEDDLYESVKKGTDRLAMELAPFLQSGMHSLHTVYRSEGTGGEVEIEHAQQSARERSKPLGMDLFFDNQKDVLGPRIKTESVHVALWTTPAALGDSAITSEDEEEKGGKTQDDEQALATHQSLELSLPDLLMKHRVFFDSMVSALGALGVVPSMVSRDDVVGFGAKAFQPAIDITGFKFVFPDTEFFAQFREDGILAKSSTKDCLWPSLASQIIKDDVVEEDVDLSIINVDGKYFTTVEVSMPPRELVLFNDLVNKFDDPSLPFQISQKLSSSTGFSHFVKSILCYLPFSTKNSRLKDSLDAVNSLKTLGEATIEYKISVSTWADSRKELLHRRDTVKQKLAAWGNAQVRNYKGSALKALVDSTPPLSKSNFGITTYAPLSGILPQLPFFRAKRIFKQSALVTVDEQGRAAPLNLTNNEEQRYWNHAVLGTPGSGKSVFLLNVLASHIYNHVREGELPYAGYIDIGHSSKIAFDNWKKMLPDELAVQIDHHKVENTKEFAQNPHDIYLGAYEPDPEQLRYMLSLYLMILTPSGQDAPHADLEPLMQQAIKDAYGEVGPDGPNTKEHNEGLCPIIDEAIAKHGFPVGSTYWDLRDAFFKIGDIDSAYRAQAYAVPIMSDVIGQLERSKTIKVNFATATIGAEKITDYAGRQLTSAIDRYPVMSNRTALFSHNVRIFGMDIEAVAPSGNDGVSRKETKVFYAFARMAVTRAYMTKETVITHVGEEYKEYQRARYQSIRLSSALTVYDEFHRALDGDESAVSTAITECREGRKGGRSLLVGTQLFADINDNKSLRELMNYFIVSNDSGDFDVVTKTLGLNQYLKSVYKYKLKGPQGSKGTQMIVKMNTKLHGTLMQSVRLVLSPFMYWCTTSDQVDGIVHSMLVEKVSSVDAIRLLSEECPYGARSRVKSIRAEHPDANVRLEPERHLADLLVAKL